MGSGYENRVYSEFLFYVVFGFFPILTVNGRECMRHRFFFIKPDALIFKFRS